MRRSRRLAALTLLFSSATLTTCVYPTEHDASVHVSLTPLKILIRGRDTTVSATAWRKVGPADSQQIANVVFVWTSSDPGVATVDAQGHVTGIKSGTANIRAAAANFDRGALAAADTVRVSAPLEIDSIRPETARFGDTITVFGVGVDSIFQAQLGQAILIPNPIRRSRDASGYARATYWVPPPAHRDSLFYIGNGVFGFSTDTVRVIQRDLYEPDDAAPATIDLDAPRPFPGTPLEPILFTNPALAFEVLPRDSVFGIDWYRLQQTTPRDLTIILTAPEVKGTFAGFVSDAFGGASAWTVGPGSHDCRGKKFSPKEAVGDSTIVALGGMPAGSVEVVALYTQPGRYGLTAVEGYVTSNRLDPRIVKDAHEEDDFCDAPGAQVAEALPFKATLTIDNPHDVDWIKFSVPSQQPVRIRTVAVPAVVAQDSSDIDVYVLHDNGAGNAPDSVGAFAHAGSTIDTTFGFLLGLPVGDYYAVVVDFAGVPTPYTICIGNCASFPAGPAPSPMRVQAAVERRAVLERIVRRSHVTVPSSSLPAAMPR